MKKILWLASWYPNKREPLSGDFIERHAKAASLYNNIHVIHVVKDVSLQRADEIVQQSYPGYSNLRAEIAYYRSSRLISIFTYFLLQRKLIKNYIRAIGKPDVVNVHIAYKAGLAALYCKWRYGIPYIVSEQWTIFCPEAKPSFSDEPKVAQWLMKLIYRHATKTTAVSQYLSESLAQRFHITLPVRIPNVADTNIFFPSSQKNNIFTFVHISVLNYQKSPEQIIDAVKILSTKTNIPFRLMMFGPWVDRLKKLIADDELTNLVDYRAEVPHQLLAEEVKKCHALVLYSRFETFGCVVVEALASGLPVIVSDIPVMRELINEYENGLFAGLENASALADKMLWMMEHYSSFNTNKIASESAVNYSYDKIGKMFDDVFKSISSPTRARLRQE